MCGWGDGSIETTCELCFNSFAVKWWNQQIIYKWIYPYCGYDTQVRHNETSRNVEKRREEQKRGKKRAAQVD